MSTNYISLKLGSTTTCIYKPENGLVLKEARNDEARRVDTIIKNISEVLI